MSRHCPGISTPSPRQGRRNSRRFNGAELLGRQSRGVGFGAQRELAAGEIDHDRLAAREAAGEHALRDGILHVAHALSVADAVEAGWSEDEYMDDANLYAACEECNLGLKSRSMEARIFLRLIQLRLRRGQQH